jgi:hypothetical protein
MKKLILLAVFVAGMIAPVASAFAQDAKGGGGGDAGGSTTTYDFDDDLVQGDLVRPDGENLMVRRRGARESLIKIREHFVPELLKSVENL